LDHDFLLNPRNIAVVGASETNTYSAGILRNLIKHGYRNPIYPINPNRKEVFGIRCYPTLLDVPETVDLVAYCIGRDQLTKVLDQAVQKEVKALLIISAGFAEADEAGKALQKKLADFCNSTGIRAIGPNCYGISNFVSGTILTPDKQIDSLIKGDISLIAQSGALAFCSLLHYGNDRNIGFSNVISTGNEADLQVSDFLIQSARNPSNKVLALFVESIKDPQKFARGAKAAITLNKPIVLLKVGKTEAGARTALTHTGSITGSDGAYDAFLRKLGVIRVNDLEELVETSAFFSKIYGRNSADGISVITSSGGLASVCADICHEYSLVLPELGGTLTEHELQSMDELLMFGNLVNPVDVRGQGIANISKVLTPFLKDDRYGIIVVACAHCGVGNKSLEIARELIRIQSQSPKIIIALWTGRKTPERSEEETGYAMLQKSNVPCFDSPRLCFSAIKSLLEYRRMKPVAVEFARPKQPTNSDLTQGIMSFETISQLLRSYDIPLAEAQLAKSEKEAVAVAKKVGFPVVLKIESPQISHKSEASAVLLNLRNEKEVRFSYNQIIKNAHAYKHDAQIRGVVVQKMVQDGIESVVGVTQDSQFGPMISFGTGGKLVEIFKDISIRLPPLSAEEASEMISELKTSKLFMGFRNQPQADVSALEKALLNISRLVVDYGEKIWELDCPKDEECLR
jgi:acetate---CoA ligase (ADP-forming)